LAISGNHHLNFRLRDIGLVLCGLYSSFFCFSLQAADYLNLIQWTSYEVDCNIGLQPRYALSQNTPHGIAHANTKALVDWQLQITEEPSKQCKLNNFSVGVDIVISLPRFTGGCSKAVGMQLQTDLNKLKQHELIHAKHGYEAKKAIVARLNMNQDEYDCATLKDIISADIKRTLKGFEEKNARYDSLTHHGLRQEAWKGD